MIKVGLDGKIYFSHEDIMTLEFQQQVMRDRGLDTDLVQKIREGQLPRYLYKYRTIEECKDILANHHLHFSRTEELCDPFENKVKYSCSNLAAIRARTHSSPMPKYSDMPPVLQDMAKMMLDDMSDQEFIKMQKQCSEAMLGECGILCLTGRPDDICMWAYYADSHKGVCLKLDLLAQPLMFCPISHVLYSKSYHNMDLAENPGDTFFRDVTLKKADIWSYEDEYRVVATHFAGNYPITNDVIADITFGFYASEQDKKDIIELAKQKGFSSSFSQVQLHPNQYKLLINSL